MNTTTDARRTHLLTEIATQTALYIAACDRTQDLTAKWMGHQQDNDAARASLTMDQVRQEMVLGKMHLDSARLLLFELRRLNESATPDAPMALA